MEISFSSPPISRRVQVSGNITLADLNDVIMQCFGWNDEHGHHFFVGKICYGPQTNGGDRAILDEADTRIHELEDGMRFIFTYLYNAGSGWECEITVEETLPPKNEVTPAVFLDGEQASPPQQFVDIHEYQSFLSDLEAAQGAKRRKMLADYNLASDFNPVYCDMEYLTGKVQQSFDK
jgi:hypothetical protein